MLKILCGPDRLENTDRLIGTICRRAQDGMGGQILIVPEQFSHEAERTLCRAGGDAISRYAEVLSFSRLAGRVFSLYGGVSEEYLDGGGRFLTAYRAVWQVREQLKCYAAVSVSSPYTPVCSTTGSCGMNCPMTRSRYCSTRTGSPRSPGERSPENSKLATV